MKFMDQVWTMKAAWLLEQNRGEPVVDVKIKFTDVAAVEELLGYVSDGDALHNANAVTELLALHSGGRYGACIALRCTRGPVPGAIGWHFDGPYATQTVQLALNDSSEYEGGRLCYFTEEKGVEVLERVAGDITKHGRETMHAVTRLSAGISIMLLAIASVALFAFF